MFVDNPVPVRDGGPRIRSVASGVGSRGRASDRWRVGSTMGSAIGLIVVVLVTFGCSRTGQEADPVFSKFRKKKNPEASLGVSERVEASLIPLSSWSDAPPGDDDDGSAVAIRVRVEGVGVGIDGSRVKLIRSTDPIELSQAAFLVRGGSASSISPFALVNRTGGVESIPIDTVGNPSGPAQPVVFDPEQSKWVTCVVHGAIALPEGRVFVAVAYRDPRPKYAVYLYQSNSNEWSRFGAVEPNAQQLDELFRTRSAGANGQLVLLFGDTQRKSAEIYHNHLHRIVLFNTKHPEGLTILNLSIETGNVLDWRVSESTLYLKTRDNRDHRNPKDGAWSLNLKKVI